MKIQISPQKRIEDALVVWFEKTPDVDIVIDPRIGLNIKSGLIKTIYAFNIIGCSDPKTVLPMVENFYDILEPGGEIYMLEMDFDYICRSYVGGDVSLPEINNDFLRKTFVNQQEIVKILDAAGFPEKDQRVWFDNMQFKKAHYEMVISGKKPKL